MTGEADGLACLLCKDGKRGIGAAEVEPVDAGGNVATRDTRSSEGHCFVQPVRRKGP